LIQGRRGRRIATGSGAVKRPKVKRRYCQDHCHWNLFGDQTVTKVGSGDFECICASQIGVWKVVDFVDKFRMPPIEVAQDHLKSLHMRSDFSGLITQVGGSNPSRATNKDAGFPAGKRPLRWAFFFLCPRRAQMQSSKSCYNGFTTIRHLHRSDVMTLTQET